MLQEVFSDKNRSIPGDQKSSWTSVLINKEVRELFREIPGTRIARLPRGKSVSVENIFLTTTEGQPSLIEIFRNRQGVSHSARIYWPAIPSCIPTLVVSTEENYVSRNSQKEGKRPWRLENHAVLDIDNHQIIITKDGLKIFPGMDKVFSENESPFCYVRRSSFILTEIRPLSILGRAAEIKIFEDKIGCFDKPQFFAHVLPQNEEENLIHGDNSIHGFCVTNSEKYVQNHPELIFQTEK
ncbi:MAG: hypothetical protein UT63_C0064G0035 [Candidatus Gottesmanbacteria bacterium GW2011_GWC2_39_8]|uniref:Uncharacterized protein n=1 Tax=Candidatus Gottesmanbacteria bacterium GW2011_GWC2_39_8 TaxID=1618450 RepID=A0A0G0PUU5_9BACT|nr:MAG: hypothetical protein UT63_C0064G0035 [Candidatus Gottesmanbacteria bacterium GW2011_GWC2_39_8]